MSDEDDEDLEAELNALVGDTGRVKPTRSKKPPVSDDHLNAMIAESMKDIPDDVSDDGDDDDPDLLNELHEIAGNIEVLFLLYICPKTVHLNLILLFVQFAVFYTV